MNFEALDLQFSCLTLRAPRPHNLTRFDYDPVNTRSNHCGISFMNRVANLKGTHLVASQSSRHPSTYFPARKCCGMTRLSTIETGPDFNTRAALKLPLQSPLVSPGASLLSSHGGGKDGSWVLSHEVQSREDQSPAHGLQ